MLGQKQNKFFWNVSSSQLLVLDRQVSVWSSPETVVFSTLCYALRITEDGFISPAEAETNIRSEQMTPILVSVLQLMNSWCPVLFWTGRWCNFLSAGFEKSSDQMMNLQVLPGFIYPQSSGADQPPVHPVFWRQSLIFSDIFLFLIQAMLLVYADVLLYKDVTVAGERQTKLLSKR